MSTKVTTSGVVLSLYLGIFVFSLLFRLAYINMFDSGGLNANYVASITSHFSLSCLQGVSLFSLSFERCTYSVTESLEEFRTRMDII